MNVRRATLGMALVCGVGLAASCHFQPDLSRFLPCTEDTACPQGYTCLVEAQRCLPDCGEQGPCSPQSGSPCYLNGALIITI